MNGYPVNFPTDYVYSSRPESAHLHLKRWRRTWNFPSREGPALLLNFLLNFESYGKVNQKFLVMH